LDMAYGQDRIEDYPPNDRHISFGPIYFSGLEALHWLAGNNKYAKNKLSTFGKRCWNSGANHPSPTESFAGMEKESGGTYTTDSRIASHCSRRKFGSKEAKCNIRQPRS